MFSVFESSLRVEHNKNVGWDKTNSNGANFDIFLMSEIRKILPAGEGEDIIKMINVVTSDLQISRREVFRAKGELMSELLDTERNAVNLAIFRIDDCMLVTRAAHLQAHYKNFISDVHRVLVLVNLLPISFENKTLLKIMIKTNLEDFFELPGEE